VLPAFLALGLALSGALPAHAGGDTDPPVLAAFDFTPKTVDVRTNSKVVTVTVRVTDDTAITNPVVTLVSDSTIQQVGPTAMDWDNTSPITNSIWTADLTLPQGAAPGTWTVRLNPLVDVFGNGEGSPHDHPTKLMVTNAGADTDPPLLKSFTFGPQTIDVSTGDKDVTIEARVTDASGVTQMAAEIKKVGGSLTTGILLMTRVSGGQKDGVWRAVATFQVGSPSGPWTVSLYPIVDTAGNTDNTTPVHPAKLVIHHPGMPKCLGQAVTINLKFGQQPTNGRDVIRGTHKPDTIDGLGGNDVICGVKSNDVIRGGPGNDILNGGKGNGDTVSYARTARPVTVSLATTAAQRTGRASGKDTIAAFEKVLGGRAGDHLTGNNGANQLTGGPGSDNLVGLGGADRLFGGTGWDRCDGGSGPDRAVACETRRHIP
jgi:hypothetical protein